MHPSQIPLLYECIKASILLVLVANICARIQSPKARWGWFLGLSFLSYLFTFAAWPVSLTALLMIALMVLWSFYQQRLRRFWPLSLAALLIVYGLYTYEELVPKLRTRQENPLQSIAHRVPVLPVGEKAVLSKKGEEQIEKIESIAYDRSRSRSIELERVHKELVKQFVRAPQLGFARMPQMQLNLPEERGPGLPEQFVVGFSPEPPPEGEMPYVGSLDNFQAMHLEATVDFINASGFGFVEDRDHVAGFEPHSFSKKPATKDFEVQSVELIGLLLHAEPVVYISAHLPSMEKLKEVSTRRLDSFEAKGLEAIRKGEELYVARHGERIRMVGAIRNTSACIKCHGGQRGDLLGAFAYSLREGK